MSLTMHDAWMGVHQVELDEHIRARHDELWRSGHEDFMIGNNPLPHEIDRSLTRMDTLFKSVIEIEEKKALVIRTDIQPLNGLASNPRRLVYAIWEEWVSHGYFDTVLNAAKQMLALPIKSRAPNEMREQVIFNALKQRKGDSSDSAVRRIKQLMACEWFWNDENEWTYAYSKMGRRAIDPASLMPAEALFTRLLEMSVKYEHDADLHQAAGQIGQWWLIARHKKKARNMNEQEFSDLCDMYARGTGAKTAGWYAQALMKKPDEGNDNDNGAPRLIHHEAIPDALITNWPFTFWLGFKGQLGGHPKLSQGLFKAREAQWDWPIWENAGALQQERMLLAFYSGLDAIDIALFEQHYPKQAQQHLKQLIEARLTRDPNEFLKENLRDALNQPQSQWAHHLFESVQWDLEGGSQKETFYKTLAHAYEGLVALQESLVLNQGIQPSMKCDVKKGLEVPHHNTEPQTASSSPKRRL